MSLRGMLFAGASVLSLALAAAQPLSAAPFGGPNDSATATPIKHVIIIIGENRTFDQVFATYQPSSGQTVFNLLSEGIINADGTPGPNFKAGLQQRASVTKTYQISPTYVHPYTTLPPPSTGGTPEVASNTNPPPFATLTAAAAADPGLLPGSVHLLLTGASGLPFDTVDTRIPNANSLPPGPFRLSPGISDDDYANSPVHRFYQMWQQVDCSVAYATTSNPTGCRMDLFPWVEVTVGAGSNGKPQPSGFNWESTGEGATSMGFYDVAAGDLSFFNKLAHEFALGDNYHQAGMGGTGVNHILLGSGDDFWYSDGHGNPATPPANEIENPNPQPNTNNYYTQDGYSGGSYSECADTSQPGVAPIVDYLNSLPYHPKPNCQPGHYYLLNNYDPGYFGNGTVDTIDTYAIPPSSTPTIADVMLAHGVSWTYFGEGWNAYVQDPQNPTDVYCNICNPFQYETKIMTNPTIRSNDIQDTTSLYNDITDDELPAVSFVKPGSLNDGHPESSKYDIFEAFVQKILLELQAKPALWNSTAVFITNDEGGGYYDSGFVQPLDYFGDGTRIPLLVVSPYAEGGRVVHSYSDHVSLLKFIEANWRLPTVSSRSRDNLPNPVTATSNPYAPTNGPAIDDLMDFFKF